MLLCSRESMVSYWLWPIFTLIVKSCKLFLDGFPDIISSCWSLARRTNFQNLHALNGMQDGLQTYLPCGLIQYTDLSMGVWLKDILQTVHCINLAIFGRFYNYHETAWKTFPCVYAWIIFLILKCCVDLVQNLPFHPALIFALGRVIINVRKCVNVAFPIY